MSGLRIPSSRISFRTRLRLIMLLLVIGAIGVLLFYLHSVRHHPLPYQGLVYCVEAGPETFNSQQATNSSTLDIVSRHLYDRLLIAGLVMGHYPAEMAQAISHDDSERMAFHALKRKDLQHVINTFYRNGKIQVMAFRGLRTELPLPVRRELRQHPDHLQGVINEALSQLIDDGLRLRHERREAGRVAGMPSRLVEAAQQRPGRATEIVFGGIRQPFLRLNCTRCGVIGFPHDGYAPALPAQAIIPGPGAPASTARQRCRKWTRGTPSSAAVSPGAPHR